MLSLPFLCCAVITTEKNASLQLSFGRVRTHDPLCGTLTWKSPKSLLPSELVGLINAVLPLLALYATHTPEERNTQRWLNFIP
jgi:hypothetical protein